MISNRFLLVIVIVLGSLSLVLIAFIVLRGVKQPQNPVVTRAADSQMKDPGKCQGNKNASARCFDCKKDSETESQINILDFSCFAKFYGSNVGKP